MKRRKGYQKKQGHKQEYTLIKILDLKVSAKKTTTTKKRGRGRPKGSKNKTKK